MNVNPKIRELTRTVLLLVAGTTLLWAGCGKIDTTSTEPANAGWVTIHDPAGNPIQPASLSLGRSIRIGGAHFVSPKGAGKKKVCLGRGKLLGITAHEYCNAWTWEYTSGVGELRVTVSNGGATASCTPSRDHARAVWSAVCALHPGRNVIHVHATDNFGNHGDDAMTIDVPDDRPVITGTAIEISASPTP